MIAVQSPDTNSWYTIKQQIQALAVQDPDANSLRRIKRQIQALVVQDPDANSWHSIEKQIETLHLDVGWRIETLRSRLAEDWQFRLSLLRNVAADN